MADDGILKFDDYVKGEPNTPGVELVMAPGRREYHHYLADQYAHFHGGADLPDLPAGDLPVAPVQVNAGRWVWQCEDCDGGVLLNVGAPAICVHCDCGWHTPGFPDNRAEIEAELLRQPGRRLFAPVRNWKPGWTLRRLQERTARANALIAAGQRLVRSLSIGATRVWVSGEVLSATNMNLHISDVADDLAGRNGAIELENSFVVTDGSEGNRYVGLPGGTQLQRPLSPGAGMIRWNTTNGALDVHNGTDWEQVLTTAAMTFTNLNARGLVGSGADQVAVGNHTHP